MKANTPEAVRIGATIKALREAYGWQSGKFAVAIGLTHGHLSNMEAGRKPPTRERVRVIADTLGVPLAAITTEFSVDDITTDAPKLALL